MHNIYIFISSLIKNLIVAALIGALLSYLLGTIGFIIMILLLIGAFVAAKNSIEEKSIEEELKGFDQALNDTINRMR